MTSIGWATLDVVPSLKNFPAQLNAQTSGAMTAAGKKGGAQFGQAAGLAAGQGFKSHMLTQAKAVIAPLAALAAGAAALSVVKGSFAEAREAATIERQTAAAIKATGGAANVTSAQIADMSEALSEQVGIDDEAIAGMQNILLTYKLVRNELGAGNDIFDQATQSILDMSTALGKDLNSTALQVGKALQDPVKGMAALSRSGVVFTQVQKDQAKAMVETGDLLGAQKIVLAELAGEFAGAADAGHDATDDLGVSFKNLQEDIGGVLLPALNGTAEVLTDDVIPALKVGGGAASDAARLFGTLPGPVKQLAAAFVILKTASAIGLTGVISSAAQSGIARTTSLMDSLRLRTMFASDAYKAQRVSADGAAASNSRLAASYAAVRAGATGAAAAARSFAAAAAPLLLLTGAITIISKFAGASAQAKADAAELTSTLEAQTGAFTENTRAFFANKLEKDGSLQDLRDLGIATNDYVAAVLEGGAAYDKVRAQLEALQSTADEGFQLTDLPGGGDGDAASYGRAIDLLEELRGNYEDAADSAVRIAEATDTSTDATDRAAPVMRNYAAEILGAEQALKDLIDREQERRDALISDRRDAIALQEVLKAGREEARKGAGGFDIGGEEGRRNLAALLDIADQFNGSTNKVRNQNFLPLREEFIKTARDMGKTKDQAEKLAENLLRVPKSAPLKFQSEGFQKRMAEIAAIKAAIEDAQFTFNLQFTGAPAPTPAAPTPRPGLSDFDRTPGAAPGIVNHGTINFTDDPAAQRAARRNRQRAGADGINR